MVAGAKYTTAPGYFDVVWDTERDRVLLSGGGDGMVRALDRKSGTWTDLSVGHHAEHMYFDSVLDQVVVSVAAKDHSPYWWNEEQNGYIAVIDAVGLTVAAPIPVQFDPWQIVADGTGYAYVSGGSGQWTNVLAVNLATGSAVKSSPNVFDQTGLQLHPDKTRIYGADTGLSPSDIHRFDLTAGAIKPSYDSPYHGDYPMCGDVRIHPAGTTLYTRCGHVFLASNTKTSDMTWTGDIGIEWRDLAIRPDGKIAYVVPDKSWDKDEYEAVLYAVDTDSLKTVATYALPAPVERVLASDDALLFVRSTLGGNPKTEVEIVPYSAL